MKFPKNISLVFVLSMLKYVKWNVACKIPMNENAGRNARKVYNNGGNISTIKPNKEGSIMTSIKIMLNEFIYYSFVLQIFYNASA